MGASENEVYSRNGNINEKNMIDHWILGALFANKPKSGIRDL